MPDTPKPALALLLTLLCPLAAGCLSPHEISETPPAPARDSVLIIPGVEGNTWQLWNVRAGLRDAGINAHIELLSWRMPPFCSLLNLCDLPANRRRAQGFADHIAALRREDPARRITLIGYSGGGGLALMTVERLPDGISIDRLILVAAAISPQYDLSPILPRVADGIVNFYSTRDTIVGWGTATFGTIDRRRCVSAGHCGFLDKSGKLRVEDNLVQIGWTPAWREHGHNGGHIDYLSRAWAKAILAPQVTATGTDTPDVAALNTPG